MNSGVILAVDPSNKPLPVVVPSSAPVLMCVPNMEEEEEEEEKVVKKKKTIKKTLTKEEKRNEERTYQKNVIALEVEEIKKTYKWILFYGLVTLFLAIVTGTVAFGTPEWRIYDVNKNFNEKNPANLICKFNYSLNTCPFYSDRKRGLFVTCYKDIETILKITPKSDLSFPYLDGSECVWEKKYNLEGTQLISSSSCLINNEKGKAYVKTYANIIRAQWICFVLGLLFLLFSFILGLSSCFCCMVNSSTLSSITAVFAMLFLLSSMCLFHGYNHMEEEVIQCTPYFAFIKKSIYKELYTNTNRYYGYSFYLGWSSFCLSLVASMFLIATSCQRTNAQSSINKALYRMRQINKEEKAEKKYQEAVEKRKRKDLEKKTKEENKSLDKIPSCFYPQAPPTPIVPTFLNCTLPPMEKPPLRFNHTYETPDVCYDLEKRKKELEEEYEKKEERNEERLRALEARLVEEHAKEKARLDMEKMRMIEEQKKKKERRRHHSSTSSSSSDSSTDSVKHKKSCKKKNNPCCNQRPSISPECGKVWNQESICCDPYTIHLPTGMNRG